VFAFVAAAAVALPVVGQVAPAAAAEDPTTRTSARVDFQTQSATAQAGYVGDYGQAFSDSTGSGWVDDRTGAPASLVGNGRARGSSASPDKRSDTFVQMQQTTAAYGGTATPGRWEYALANGTYTVSVGVGDATAVNSTHTIVAEPGGTNAVTLVDAVKPTTATPFATGTATVTVTDGRLTLSPSTGVNTKIGWVSVDPAATAPPNGSTRTSGHVDFQTQSATAQTGYTGDYGLAWSDSTGSGWVDDRTGTPASLVGNGRVRGSSASPDKRSDSFLQVQQTTAAYGGTVTPGRWEYALANGTYAVTVGVGDATAVNSTYTVVAEPGGPNAVTLVDAVRPTTAAPFTTATKTVTVSDGKLTLSPAGGSNGKFGYVDVVPAGGPTGPTGTIVASSPDDAALGLPNPRLIFSTVRGRPTPPARAVTFTNTGGTPLTVSGLATTGADASSFRLAEGQATSVTVPAGGTAQVALVFTPTDPANCPSPANTVAIADVVREAQLSYTTAAGAGSVDVSGLVTCNVEGNNEPTLQQVVESLGYDISTYRQYGNERFMGAQRYQAGSDEIYSPYFTPADPSRPVTLTPVAHYGSRNTASTYGKTGWIARGAVGSTVCSSTCKNLYAFPGDTSSSYTENQKLMPAVTGSTSFTPGGAFGLFHGDFGDVNYSDDSFNPARTTSGATISPTHYLHDLRVYPAHAADGSLVPDTFVVGVDITRVPAYKNNDFEDVVFVLRNATPAEPAAATPGAATTVDLTKGGTVNGSCAVTGFDGVLPNTAGNQCNAPALSFTPSGLQMTSTSGQLSNDNQRNALYKNFNASTAPFTVTTRVQGPITTLSEPYQQVATFFGPDQKNFVKAEVEYQGSGTDPHATFFFEEDGVGRSVSTTSLPAVTTADTIDLIIKADTSEGDTDTPATDAGKARGYPLTKVRVFYAINGGTPVQIGTTSVSPKNVTAWFGRSAKAGVLVSGAGSSVPYTATISSFAITNG
jgi:hypothetical protein